MPEKVDKMRLSETQDRRRKLTDDQKEMIREEYAIGGITHAQLAEKYGVSRSLVTIIVNPDRAEKVKNRVKENWKRYYDEEKHREAIKDTRHYKKKLLEKGELK